jgi:hypothetical protein
MAELVVKLGLRREPRYLYVVGDGKVYRAKMVPASQMRGLPDRPPGPEDVVVDLGITQDPAYDYFVDRNGDISRTPRSGPPLVHPPGDFEEPAEEREKRLERAREQLAELIGPCSVCGKPVIGREPPRDDQGRRRHPRCA